MTQEFSRHSVGDFCVAGLLNIIAKKGYIGKEMNAIMEVGMHNSHYYRSLKNFNGGFLFRQSNKSKLAWNARIR